MPAFVQQVVEMRYTDTEILAQELDRKLGPKNWKCEVFASHIVLKLSRALNSQEIAEIKDQMQLRYEENKMGK